MAREKQKDPQCSFCGATKRELGSRPMISGLEGYICADCVERCHDLLISSGASAPRGPKEAPTGDAPREALRWHFPRKRAPRSRNEKN